MNAPDLSLQLRELRQLRDRLLTDVLTVNDIVRTAAAALPNPSGMADGQLAVDRLIGLELARIERERDRLMVQARKPS